MKCQESGCRSLQTTCTDCGRVVITREFAPGCEWISVKDRLPEEYAYCLVFAKKEGTEPSPFSIARQYQGVWEMMSDEDESNAVACGDLTWGMEGCEVTHWVPLPEPPKEK